MPGTFGARIANAAEVKYSPAVSDPTVQLLLTTVDALRDLLGELIDLQPPDTQKALADLQADLYQAVADFHAQQEGE